MANRRFDSKRTTAAQASARRPAARSVGVSSSHGVQQNTDSVRTPASSGSYAPTTSANPRASGQQGGGPKREISGPMKQPKRGTVAAGPAGVANARGLGLRAKFMLVLTGITAVVLIGLGLAMAGTVNSFLFGQKQHDGIEIARMSAQIANAVNVKLKKLKSLTDKRLSDNEVAMPTQQEIKDEIVGYLTDARDWGMQGVNASDILAIRFDCPGVPEIAGVGIGVEDSSTVVGTQFTSIYVPKLGANMQLNKDFIQVYPGVKATANGEVPIYRFKIFLDSSFGKTATGENAHVRVDIAADSVKKVRNNLFTTIGIAVIIAIGVVIAVANWLAGNITKPLDLLIHDMKVVSRGRLDHETKPRSKDEIGQLAVEFNRMTQNLKVAQVALVEQEKAEYELSIAHEVQRQLLPAEAPAITGYDCAAFYQGAKAVSGDYFDFIPLGNGLWGFIVADVSGKGIPGSMVMAVTRTIVRLVANKYQHRAADTLKDTNRLIARQIKRGMFVTAFYAILDERTGGLTYASAGHNPMVIYRAATGTYELGTGKGIALGFNEGPVFDKTIQETRTVLQPGDTMVIFTDGFPEAMNAENQEFGEERFYEAIARYGAGDARTMLARVVEEIAEHRGDAEQSDDLTIISVKRTS